MNKRRISIFLAIIMLTMAILPAGEVNAILDLGNIGSGNNNQDKTRANFEVKCNGDRIKEKVTFILRDEEGKEDYATSGDHILGGFGQLPHQINFMMEEGKEYTLEISENDDYDMEPIRLVLKEDGKYKKAFSLDSNQLIKDLNIIERIDESVEDEFNENKKIIKTAPLRVTDGGGWDSVVTEEVTFKLFNSTKQRFEGEYKSNEKGNIPPMDVIKADKYILSLKENENYAMDNQYFIHYENGNVPEKLKGSGKIFSIKLKKKEEDSFINERVRTVLPVKHYGKSLDGIELSFISEIDRVDAVSENGQVTVDLLEDITYVIDVKDDNYISETYPLVIKDKSEWGEGVGKNPYNHSTCDLISVINLLKKSQKMPEGAVKSKSGKTIAYGPRFNNLRLNVIHIEKSDIKSLEDKNVEVYKINLMNPFREEITKLAKGDFKIERLVKDGQKVKQVYELKNKSELVKLDFKQDGNKVTFENDSFSINPIVFEFEDKAEEPKDPEDKPSESKKFKDVNFRLITDKGVTIPNTEMALYLWDYDFVETGIPSISRHLKTDNNGNLNIGDLNKNSKYELRLRDSSYITNQYYTIITDKDGFVDKINDKKVKDNSFDFLISSQDGEISENVHSIKMYAKDKSGNNISGAEFAASVISPKLYEYKRVKSDNGLIDFSLEDGVYGITVSKRGMFYYDFEPSIIMIEVIDGEAFVIDNEDKKPLTESNGTFILEKVDKIGEKDELRALIEDGKVLIEESYLYDNELINNLKDILNGAEEEIKNEHTSPHYVEGFIDRLKKAIDDVRASSNVVKEQDLILIAVNDKGKFLAEDIEFYISGITNQTCMKEKTANSMLNISLVEGEYSIRPTEEFEAKYEISPKELNISIKDEKIFLLDKEHKEIKELSLEDCNITFVKKEDKPKDPEDKPVEPKDPEDKPVEPKDPEDKPVEPKDPEDKPVEPKDPEDKPVEPKDPEDKPVEPKDPEDKPLGKDFTDVSKNYWGYKEIKKLQEENIVDGYLDGSLKPEKNISRGELASLLVKAFNIEKADSKISFKDISKKDWYYDAVIRLANLGIIKGYEDGSFKGEQSITREELITILVRLKEYRTGEKIEEKEANFKDMNKVSTWAKKYINKGKSGKIIKGYEDNTIKAKKETTRMEAFSMIYKAKAFK